MFLPLAYLASVKQEAKQFDVIIPESHNHDTPLIPTNNIGILRIIFLNYILSLPYLSIVSIK